MRATVRCELYQSKQPCVASYITMHVCATTRGRHRYRHVGSAGTTPNNTANRPFFVHCDARIGQ
eukprot:10430540-Alexandrium_andersonii.AAC.1